MFAAPIHKYVIVCKISFDIEDMALAELPRITSEDKDYQEVFDIVLSRKYEGKLLRTSNNTQHTNTAPNGTGCQSTGYFSHSTDE